MITPETGLNPEKQPSPMMQFALDELRLNPEISFADLKARAVLHGLTLYPMSYQRAKVQLGLAPVQPRRRRKKRSEEEALAAPIHPRNDGDSRSSDGEAAEPSSRRGRPFGPLMTAAMAHLQRSPAASFQEAQAELARQSLTINYAIYARARARLGLTRPRGKKGATSEPAFQLGAAASAPSTAIKLDELVRAIRELTEERDHLRDALDRIAQIVAELG